MGVKQHAAGLALLALLMMSGSGYRAPDPQACVPGLHEDRRECWLPLGLQVEVGKLLEQPLTDQEQSLVFVSAESSASVGFDVTNRIMLRRSERVDLWLMEQVAGRVSTVALAVDKSHQPPLAAYLEWEGGFDAPSELAKRPLIAPSVPCFRCHSSGPRSIRPLWGPMPEIMSQWNNIIEDYGVVETWLEPDRRRGESQSGRLASNGPFNWQSLDLPGAQECSRCHSSTSGVRSPLLVQHRDSAVFLKKVGAMPPPEPMHNPVQQELWLGASTAQLSIKVDTSVGSFRITGATLSVAGGCSEGSPRGHEGSSVSLVRTCNGQAKVDLASVTTGLAMRDRHLEDLVLATEGGSQALATWTCEIDASINVADVDSVALTRVPPAFDASWPARCQANINWLEQVAPVQVDLKFGQEEGRFFLTSLDASLQLSAFGVPPIKRFLVSVLDGVSISLDQGLQAD